jgi:hypothetical protein
MQCGGTSYGTITRRLNGSGDVRLTVDLAGGRSSRSVLQLHREGGTSPQDPDLNLITPDNHPYKAVRVGAERRRSDSSSELHVEFRLENGGNSSTSFLEKDTLDEFRCTFAASDAGGHPERRGRDSMNVGSGPGGAMGARPCEPALRTLRRRPPLRRIPARRRRT